MLVFDRTTVKASVEPDVAAGSIATTAMPSSESLATIAANLIEPAISRIMVLGVLMLMCIFFK